MQVNVQENSMSQQIILNQQLLKNIKREAKKKKRENGSLNYNQWLNILSSQYGHATFESLMRRVKEIEQEELDQSMALEKEKWVKRFEESLVWGNIDGDGGSALNVTFPLPVSAGSIPWPNCFCGSSLFTCADGPRRQFDGSVKSLDGPEMYFRGEELRVGEDNTVLMALISVAGKLPCGTMVEFSRGDLDEAIGLPLPDWGIPVQYDAIARVLWRLTNSELTVSKFKFNGSILFHADARQQPERFKIRFNPKFANFFYPILALLD